MTGCFYIVATPIGNLSDVTLRAVETLKTVDYIACEDTRTTKIISDKYSITAKLFDCHKFNEKEKSKYIINLLKSGHNVALVSDAGTPCISDPGSSVIGELIKENIRTIPIPGACAISTLLSAIERKNEIFAFIGFLPKTLNQKQDILKKFKSINTVFYESPNRLLKTLKDISEILGEDTQITIGRELTKIHEEIKTDNIIKIINYYKNNILKGEIVGMIYGKEEEYSESEIADKIHILKKLGYTTQDCIKIIINLFGTSKNQVYKLVTNIYKQSNNNGENYE